MHAAFRRGGREAIDKVMRTQPAAFLKLLVLLVPREMKVEHRGGVKAMTDEQIEAGNHGNAERDQPTLPAHGVGKRTTRHLSDHARQAAGSQGEPDILFRPAQFRQVEREKRAEAHLNVG